MANDCHLRPATFFLFFQERASLNWIDAKNLKEVCRNSSAGNALWLTLADKRKADVGVEHSDSFEALALFLPIQEIASRGHVLLVTLGRVALPYGHQTIRIFEQQRSD